MTEPTDDEIEAAARAVYEVEYPRYDPAAHPDHNRWSWAGDGNSETVKDGYRAYAKAALAAALPLVEARLREEIAGEIVAEYAKVAADEGATLEDDRIITAICNGLLRARRVVRGQ